jgi:hypothetical protein
MRAFKPLVFSTLTLVLALVLGTVRAAEDDVDHSGLGSVPDPLKKMLPVALHDKRLALDQEAWTKTSDETPEQKRKTVAERLSKRMHVPVENVPPQMIDNMINSSGGIAPVDLFQTIMDEAGGGAGGSSSSSGGRSYTLNYEGRNMHGALSVNMNAREFQLKLAERIGSKRVLSVSDDKLLGFTIHFANTAKASGFVFVQAPGGPACLASYNGKNGVSLSAENFIELLHKDPKGVEENFIKPLMDLGLDFPFSRNHPAVKKMVANGFNPAAPDTQAKVLALLKTLEDDDQDVREKAFKDLVPLYPEAIFEISEALKNTHDPEVKKRLETVAGNYPALQMAREFVLLEKLSENREYLIELLKDPAYKDGARQRLTALVGKDYGEDPAAWAAK